MHLSSSVLNEPLLYNKWVIFHLDPSGEVSDTDEYEVKDTPIEGDRHSVIMNVLSQLKLGTDLTNVRIL